MIKLKRAYEPRSRGDGFRILVERLWPRGISKEKADVDLWLKEIAPSADLRKWYAHDVEKWPDFRKRYTAELRKNIGPLDDIREHIRSGVVTFVYAARDVEHNSAVVLKEFLEAND